MFAWQGLRSFNITGEAAVSGRMTFKTSHRPWSQPGKWLQAPMDSGTNP